MYFIKLIIIAMVIELISCFGLPKDDQSSKLKVIETEQCVNVIATNDHDKTKSPGELTIKFSIP
jgi:hypothetical protein